MKINRSIKFQVLFPGLRKEDFRAMAYTLAVTQGDMARAANDLTEALSIARRGLIEQPMVEGKTIHWKTLAYWGLTGRWQPFKAPLYTPSPDGREISGGCKSALASFIYDRLESDEKALRKDRNRPRHSVFKVQPIRVRSAEIKILPNGDLRLCIWAMSEKKRSAPLIIRPYNLKNGHQEVYKRIRSGDYKMGSGSLYKDPKTSKWTFSLSWEGDVVGAAGDVVAGIDLGVVTTCTIAYIEKGESAPLMFKDRTMLQEDALRAWDRVYRERRDLLRHNREEYHLREGRGKGRKCRIVEDLATVQADVIQTAIRQLAAATVASVQRRGASVIALEDLSWTANHTIAQTEHLQGRAKARSRIRYLRWHQGALRNCIRNAAEKVGIKVISVNCAYSSKMCHSCGTIWTASDEQRVREKLKTQEGTRVMKSGEGFGRLSQSKFACDCGYTGHADHNAAINIARRGVDKS